MTYYTKLLFSQKELLHAQFLETDLGHLYLAIPFEALAKKVPAPPHAQSGTGCKPWFDVKGGIALQFLKHHLGVSDEKLIARINTDWAMQLFCGISLKPGEYIRDKDIVGTWRKYLGTHMDMSAMQEVFAKYWKPYMQNTSVGGQDAKQFSTSFSASEKYSVCARADAILSEGKKNICSMQNFAKKAEGKKKNSAKDY